MKEFMRWLNNWRTSAMAAFVSLLLSLVHQQHGETVWFCVWLFVFVIQAIVTVKLYWIGPGPGSESP